MGESAPCFMHLFPPDQDLPSQRQQQSLQMRASKLMAMASSLSSSASPPHSFFTYQLGPSALYIPLTARCNSRTLPELRGDNFLLPAHVVAALCRVRDAETSNPQWAGWCAYLDTQEASQKLPPSLEPIATASKCEQENHRPTIDELFAEIQSHMQHPESQLKSVVFSGEGEPTLRFQDMLGLSKKIQESSNDSVSIRLTTNGLATAAVDDTTQQLLQQCLDHGISHVSVGLHTGDAAQFDDIVQPVMPPSSHISAHERVCDWIQQAANLEGLEVEVTAVERADVDKAKTEGLAKTLGVESPIRWRPYFP